jgi:glycosyltransferase involved in cell wall biosynthesis
MRILFLTPHPPSAVRVRPFHLVPALLDRGHELTVATTWSGARERQDLLAMAGLGCAVIGQPLGRARRLANLLAAWPTRLPLQARYAWQPRLAAELGARLTAAADQGRPYEVLHCEHLRGVAFALHLQSRLPVVWDSVDSITDLFSQARRHSGSRRGRLMAAVDLERTRSYEGWLMRQLRHVAVTSPADRAALLATAAASNGGGPVAQVAVVPNGVDCAHFAPSRGWRDPETILMTGRLSYHANVTAARFLVESVMPGVWAQRPHARVILAGAEPTREVRALARAEPQRVELTGTVGDLRPYLHRATLAVAPMVYGVGIQNKVLEAMATATPVVATATAVRALNAQPGRDVLVAEDAPALARLILELLGDPGWATAVGAAGRAYVERAHRWEDAAARLEELYLAAAGSRRRLDEGRPSGYYEIN